MKLPGNCGKSTGNSVLMGARGWQNTAPLWKHLEVGIEQKSLGMVGDSCRRFHVATDSRGIRFNAALKKPLVPTIDVPDSCSNSPSRVSIVLQDPDSLIAIEEYPLCRYQKSYESNSGDNQTCNSVSAGSHGPPYFVMKNGSIQSETVRLHPPSKRHYFDDLQGIEYRKSYTASFESTDKNSGYETSDFGNTVEDFVEENPISISETVSVAATAQRRQCSGRRKTSRTKKRHRYYNRRQRLAKMRKLKKNPSSISDNLCVAIVATLFCCFPLGLVSLFYAWKVQRALSSNSIDEAKMYSLKGRKFANTGVMMGITTLALIILVLIVKENVPYSSLQYDYYLPDYVGA